ncbi:hypothetical protein Hanom_Chr15g01390111 [Helianthus anomalus]
MMIITKKAIYYHNNEQPTRKQTEEGSSKGKKHAMLTLHDDIQDDNKWKIQEDKGFNWNDYIKNERNEQTWVLVAEIKRSREEEEARGYLDNVYDAYKEARSARRWDVEKECYVDPKGNPIVDLDEVDFDALVVVIPTMEVWCRGLREISHYREKFEEGINKQQVKKADTKAEEKVAKKQQKVEEDQKAEETTMPNAEVKTQSESSDMLDRSDHKTDEKCKKCMETCKACTEKDENLRSRDIELTKIEKIFKEKCKMLENEQFLKQENEKLTQKCDDLVKDFFFETTVFS